jgi:hypothetical protein
MMVTNRPNPSNRLSCLPATLFSSRRLMHVQRGEGRGGEGNMLYLLLLCSYIIIPSTFFICAVSRGHNFRHIFSDHHSLQIVHLCWDGSDKIFHQICFVAMSEIVSCRFVLVFVVFAATDTQRGLSTAPLPVRPRTSNFPGRGAAFCHGGNEIN